MSDDLAPGLYEELVSAALVGRLASIKDALVERNALRPADAADRIAQHLAREVVRAIDAVPREPLARPRSGDRRARHPLSRARVRRGRRG